MQSPADTPEKGRKKEEKGGTTAHIFKVVERKKKGHNSCSSLKLALDWRGAHRRFRRKRGKKKKEKAPADNRQRKEEGRRGQLRFSRIAALARRSAPSCRLAVSGWRGKREKNEIHSVPRVMAGIGSTKNRRASSAA